MPRIGGEEEDPGHELKMLGRRQASANRLDNIATAIKNQAELRVFTWPLEKLLVNRSRQ